MKINHNLRANFILLQSEKVLGALRKSTERLASGERINAASDDASGLAVSERMRTQIRGLRQAEFNTQNGISFTQVADGNLNQVSQMLQRIRELAVQSANGIYSLNDREAIQMEVSQLVEEIDRIATQAQFNRLRLFTGDYSRDQTDNQLFFHVGPDKDMRIQAYIGTISSRALGLSDATRRSISLSTPDRANNAISTVDAAIDKLNRGRADIGSQGNRLNVTLDSILEYYTNMVEAESRIRDTDMAREMIEYTREKMLLQSNTSLLAQSNLEPKLVADLLE
jgi:flagellin